MDGIHDMGGMQGWGTVATSTPTSRPSTSAWQGRAFAISLLSMNRLTGRNLDAMRHALDRLTPLDYLANGYYGRWLLLPETLLTDSGVIAPGAVDARARKLRGEDVTEPPDARPQQARLQADRARFAARQLDDRAPVQGRRSGAGQGHASRRATPGCPATCGAASGTVRAVQPAAVLPDTNAHFLAENAQHGVCHVASTPPSCGAPTPRPSCSTSTCYDDYLEPVS